MEMREGGGFGGLVMEMEMGRANESTNERTNKHHSWRLNVHL